MVAYHYIEGYQPQAYNLTKTLSKNEAENVFTFVYEPVPEDTVTTETEGTYNYAKLYYNSWNHRYASTWHIL